MAPLRGEAHGRAKLTEADVRWIREHYTPGNDAEFHVAHRDRQKERTGDEEKEGRISNAQ